MLNLFSSLLGGMMPQSLGASKDASKSKGTPTADQSAAGKSAGMKAGLSPSGMSSGNLQGSFGQLLQMMMSMFSGGAPAASDSTAPSYAPGYEGEEAYEDPYYQQPPPPKEYPKETVIGSGKKTTKIGNLTIKHSPLTLDMNGDGVKTSNKLTRFDIDGNGTVDTINDISPEDALLSIDADGNGASGENGKELLGDNTDLSRFGIQGKFQDGFEALNAIAAQAKQRGLINQDDTLDSNELKVLESAYGLKAKQGSLNARSQSADAAGIQDINLASGAKKRISNFDNRGNDTLQSDGATFTRADGRILGYEDIFFQAKA